MTAALKTPNGSLEKGMTLIGIQVLSIVEDSVKKRLCTVGKSQEKPVITMLCTRAHYCQACPAQPYCNLW